MLNNQEEKAIELLDRGLRIYPQNVPLNYKKAKLLTQMKYIEDASYFWGKVIKDSSTFYLSKNDFKYAYRVFQECGNVKGCMSVLERNVLEFPNDEETLFAYVNKSILYQPDKIDLKDTIHIVSETIPNCSQTDKDKRYLLLSILYNLIEDGLSSSRCLKQICDAKVWEKAPLKAELFNNNESKIEYYKKASKTESIIVTFDHMYMDWDALPFGYSFLKRQNIDIIAVRKRRRKTYQQDLSLEEFENSLKPLLSNYKNIFFYGHSLGAYLALYYGVVFNNIEIFVTAPRLSIHPLYGKKKLAGEGFQHHLHMGYNNLLKPKIAYDPKNKRDRKYIEQEISKSYPNACLIKIPYGGHGIVKHLRRMGKLKEYLSLVLNHKTPVYEKEYRYFSSDYYRELANHCYKRNKLNWAYDLIEEALKLSPEEYKCIKLSIEICMDLEKWNKALEKLNEKMLEWKPELLLYLFDIYISTGRINAAENLLKAMKNKCNKKAVKKRKKLLISA